MLIESFLDYLRLERNYSERTIVSYRTDLREFGGFLENTEAELDWKKVHADHVRNWMVSLMEGGKAATSVNRKLSSLRSFYRFLLWKKLVAVNPMLKIVGPKKKKPLPFIVGTCGLKKVVLWGKSRLWLVWLVTKRVRLS